MQRQLDGQDVTVTCTELQAEVSTWEQQFLAQDLGWETLDPINFARPMAQDLIKQSDLSLVSSGPCPDKDVYAITAHVHLETISTFGWK